MKTGKEIALSAMKMELKRLSLIADREKRKADEAIRVGSEIISINNEFRDLIEKKDYGTETSKKLDELKKRSDRANKVRKLSLIKLLDNQYEAEKNRDELLHEIREFEYRWGGQ